MKTISQNQLVQKSLWTWPPKKRIGELVGLEQANVIKGIVLRE